MIGAITRIAVVLSRNMPTTSSSTLTISSSTYGLVEIDEHHAGQLLRHLLDRQDPAEQRGDRDDQQDAGRRADRLERGVEHAPAT